MELKIEHLSKQFKDKTAVNDVNLTLTPGVWGLLGANGAGKTTLMRMIADIMTPTNGAVYYDGKDIRELGEVYRSKFGFLPQDFGYHRDFTVKDYLEYMAALKDIPTRATAQKSNHLLDILSLSDVKKKKISNAYLLKAGCSSYLIFADNATVPYLGRSLCIAPSRLQADILERG